MTRGHAGLPRRPITVLYWVWGLATIALCGYAVADAVWQLVLCALWFGVFGGIGDPIWSTLMQTRVPPQLRGRVASMDWLVSVGLTPVSFALVGPVAALAGAQTTLFAAGLLGFAGVIATLYLVPGLREPRVTAQPASASRR
jgi:MFS family permease